MQLRSRSVSNSENSNQSKMISNDDLMEVLLSNKADLSTLKANMESMQYEIQELKNEQKDIVKTVENLTERADENHKAIFTGDNCIKSELEKTKNALLRTQISVVNSQFNSMQYNVLVYNVPEKLTAVGGGKKRETQADSIEKAFFVLEEVFGIEDARETISLSTAHRLPTTSAGACRPLIFKLSYLSDKSILWDAITNVKDYNQHRDDNQKIRVQMVQLPPKLARDKQSLLTDYMKAREEGKRPKWRYLKKTGVYCYIVNNVYYKPKVDYFLNDFVNETNMQNES